MVYTKLLSHLAEIWVERSCDRLLPELSSEQEKLPAELEVPESADFILCP